jgi:CheY-like chemotaxis protein
MARLLRLLLVEDQSDDAYLFSVIAETAASAVGVHWVRDGQEAIEYLQGTGAYRDRSRFPIPDLIVLDLRMHGFDGFDLLRWLKESASSHIPDVVWTGSVDPKEIQKGLGLGAAGVFTKPVRFEELVSVVGKICAQGRLPRSGGRTMGAEAA